MSERDELENKILSFFDRNPDEELTYQDAFIKFGYPLSKTEDVMRSLARREVISWRLENSGKKVFMHADCLKP